MAPSFFSALVLLSFVSSQVVIATPTPRSDNVESLERRNLGLHAGDDLLSFVTRPDLKPPKYHVMYHSSKSRIAPGYWFVSPYNFEDNENSDVRWETCQIGPTIYDNEGELVWSGACDFPNKIVFDFHVSKTWDSDEPFLAGLVQHADFPEQDVGAGFFIGSDYKIRHSYIVEPDNGKFDMHELNIQADGRMALVAHKGTTQTPGFEIGYNQDLWIKDDGFREIDMASEEVVFEWKVHDWIGLDESTFDVQEGRALGDNPNTNWDPFHLNAIDKTRHGDYIVSLRHCDMLVMIDGENGRPIWRAGGPFSDFKMLDGLIWSRQHDVRLVSHNVTHTVVSFLDNAKSGNGGQEPTHDFSRGVIISLHHQTGKPQTARLLRSYDRPDMKYSERRGNLQQLPNGNVWMTWTDDGYITEYTSSGEALMEARWGHEERFGTYRGYKYANWVGKPRDSPVVVAQASGVHDAFLTTIYVSWNGATEVKYWDFYDDDEFVGRVNRTGFETAFVANRKTNKVRATALDAKEKVLGVSRQVKTEAPKGWSPNAAYKPYGHAKGFVADEDKANPNEVDKLISDEEELTASMLEKQLTAALKAEQKADLENMYYRMNATYPWYIAAVVLNIATAITVTVYVARKQLKGRNIHIPPILSRLRRSFDGPSMGYARVPKQELYEDRESSLMIPQNDDFEDTSSMTLVEGSAHTPGLR